MDRTFSWKKGILITLAIAGITLCANAGIPEKYGEQHEDRNGQKLLRVKFFIRNKPLEDYGSQWQGISYIDYYNDGTVKWNWNTFNEGHPIEIKGQRSDSAGSFKVTVGDIVGYDYIFSNNTSMSGEVCIYPMMQFEEANILLIDKDVISFNVGVDEIVSMEWSGVPPQAKAGFGFIDRKYNYDYGYKDAFYVDEGESTYYPFGPTWLMFTDFSMTPLMPDQNSVEDIGADSVDKDNQFYDLFGRKVNGQPQTPGIYICNGRKILIK